tara:strand:+ start:7996 stop:9723 length:1728 start_codon:yes stop_codon:yes gene_type:complete
MNKLEKILFIIGNKNKNRFKYLLVLNILNFFLEFASIISIPIFLAILIGTENFYNKFFFLQSFDRNELIFYAGLFVTGAFLIKNLFYINLIRLQANFLKEIKITISEKLFNFYLFDSFLENINVNPSIKARNVTSEIQGFNSYVVNLNKLLLDGTAITIVFFIIFFATPLVSLTVFVIFLIISVLYFKLLKPKIKNKSKVNQDLLAKFTQMIYETFGAFKDVKVLNKEKEIFNLYKKKVEKYEENLLFFSIFDRFPKIILELTSIILLVILSSIFLRNNENLNELLPLLALVVVSVVRLLPAFSGMNTSLFYMKVYTPHLEKIYSELRIIHEKGNLNKNYNQNDVFKSNVIINNEEYIKLKNVSFNYENKKKLLDNISLNIKKGSTFGIIGPTGSGKSTLLQIMMGLLKPSSGNVYFNNSNISKINQEWIKNISYVSQNVFLLDDTVEKNITFNFDNLNVDKNKIEKALEIAELSPKILSLPNGIYEKVGVDGLKFSGGERQRLAIARAVYKEAPILFLDEFTSSLDVLTEEKILKNFKNHFSDKTIILITHRQNTIEKCDKLWELKNLNTDHEN